MKFEVVCLDFWPVNFADSTFSMIKITGLEISLVVVIIKLDRGYLSYSYANARYHLEDPKLRHYFHQSRASETKGICLRIEGTPSKS